MSDKGWSGRSKGTAWGWHFVLKVLSITGRKPAYLLVRAIAFWYVLFFKSPGLEDFCKRVLPGKSLFKIRAEIYSNFAISLVDRLAFLLWGPTEFRYRYEGIEHLRGAFLGEGGRFCLGAILEIWRLWQEIPPKNRGFSG
jgi:hypothetical protein